MDTNKLTSASSKPTTAKTPSGPGSPPTNQTAAKSHGPRSGISRPSDSDEDETVRPIIIVKSHWFSVRNVLATVAFIAFAVGSIVSATIYIQNSGRKAEVVKNSEIALSRYVAVHKSDGRTVPEIALVDTIRQCVTNQVLLENFIAKNTVEYMIGKGISEAEMLCLEIEIASAQKDLFFAIEASSRDKKPEHATINTMTAYHHVMFIISFAKSKKYLIPPEYADVKYDASMLWTYYEDITNQREKISDQKSPWQY